MSIFWWTVSNSGPQKAILDPVKAYDPDYYSEEDDFQEIKGNDQGNEPFKAERSLNSSNEESCFVKANEKPTAGYFQFLGENNENSWIGSGSILYQENNVFLGLTANHIFDEQERKIENIIFKADKNHYSRILRKVKIGNQDLCLVFFERAISSLPVLNFLNK